MTRRKGDQTAAVFAAIAAAIGTPKPAPRKRQRAPGGGRKRGPAAMTGDELRALVDGASVSQQEAARRIRIAYRTMRYYIAGTYPIPRRIAGSARRKLRPVPQG